MGVDFHAQLVAGIRFDRETFFTKGKAIKKCRYHGAKSGSHCDECGNRLKDDHEEIPAPAMLHACEAVRFTADEVMGCLRDQSETVFKLGLFAVDCDSPPIVLGEQVASSDSSRIRNSVTAVSTREVDVVCERVRQSLIKLFLIKQDPELFVIGYVSY